MTVLKTVYTVIDRIRTAVIIVIFSFIIIIGAVQIFMRYTPGINPMSWVDEIMRYVNIWLVMLSASIGVKHGSHLKMDFFLYKLVRDKWIPRVKIITSAMIVAALLILIYFGLIRTLDNLRTIIHSLPISISWFYAAIPIGGLLILLDYLLIFIFGSHPFVPVRSKDIVLEV